MLPILDDYRRVEEAHVFSGSIGISTEVAWCGKGFASRFERQIVMSSWRGVERSNARDEVLQQWHSLMFSRIQSLSADDDHGVGCRLATVGTVLTEWKCQNCGAQSILLEHFCLGTLNGAFPDSDCSHLDYLIRDTSSCCHLHLHRT